MKTKLQRLKESKIKIGIYIRTLNKLVMCFKMQGEPMKIMKRKKKRPFGARFCKIS